MKNVWEILEDFKNAPPQLKEQVLAENGTPLFKTVLQGAYRPDIQFVIKELPPYIKSDAPPGLGYTTIAQEMHRIYLFVEGSKKADPNLSLERKRAILIQMLEAMEPKEAEVFANMITKDLKVPG